MTTVFLVSHYTPTQGIIDKFKEYFYSKKGFRTYLVQHPLYPSSGLPSRVVSQNREVTTHLPAGLQFAIEGFASLFLLKKLGEKINKAGIALCFDPLAFLHMFLLKRTLGIKKVVYYNMDFSTQRFENKFMNAMYRLIDRFAYKKSDFFVSVTEEYINYTDPKGKYRDKNIIIRHFVETKLVKKVAKQKNSIVFAGTLSKTIDFEPLLLAVRKLKDSEIKFVLDIYGTGTNEPKVRRKVKSLGLNKEVAFKGTVENKKLVREILPRYEIAVAPYISKDKSVSDHMFRGIDLTSKLVEYLAAGTPIVTTRLFPAFDVIEEKRFGFLVSNKDEWYSALKNLLTDDNTLKTYSENASRYAKRYDTETVLTPIVKKVLP